MRQLLLISALACGACGPTDKGVAATSVEANEIGTAAISPAHPSNRDKASSSPGTTGKFLRSPGAVPGQYIVVLEDPAPGAREVGVPAFARELAARHGATVTRTYEHALRGFAVRTSERGARALAAESGVKYVVEDGEAHPVETRDRPTWGLDRVDQRALPLSNTYSFQTTGIGVHAYVIDTGIRASHAEFGGRVSLDYTAVNDGNGASDCNGHGTHVAGTIGGATWGVAKAVHLHSVRVFGCSGGAAWSTIIGAVDWVTANHIKPAVVNMSLGGGANQAVDDAVRNSVAAGVVYAVAAGNGSGADACGSSPARTHEALTVGSTDSNDSRSSFSSIGSCVDLFAPGGGITSAWWSGDTATNTLSGTSMATPHVAGAAALYLETQPFASPASVAEVLLGHATPGKVGNAGTGSPNRLLFTGFLVGRRVALQSYNIPGAYIRHANALGELSFISSELDKREATYRIVPGLAGAGTLSFEAVNCPGTYLRHQDFRLKQQWPDGSELFKHDASFREVPGLANSSWKSYESYNMPGHYLRHRGWQLWVESGSDNVFLSDATFYPSAPFVHPEQRVSLRSYNSPDAYVRHANALGELSFISSELDRQDATFRIVPGLAGEGTLSFEAVNYPGTYLRHQDFLLKQQRPDGSELFKHDASFREVPGLANSSWKSYESYNMPGHYLRHRGWYLWVEPGSDNVFLNDATFRPVGAFIPAEY